VIETLLQITGPHFAAGVVARDGRVIQTAPILARVIRNGMSGGDVAAQCRKMGWSWEIVHKIESAP